MNILLFYHSLVSDWNHGNAHFLRGITRELLQKGHTAQVWEPKDGWSYRNWKEATGESGLREFREAYPMLEPNFYDEETDLESVVSKADLVLVHEWNDPDLVGRLGELKSRHGFTLLFHDTHHRSVTAPEEIARYDLSEYDGVLAFGEFVKQLYLENGWANRAWTWHEAADHRIFRPLPAHKEGDLVWIGNWGDDERTEELQEFLIEPVKRLGLDATMYGVRYPDSALAMLEDAGIEYGGYLPSHRVPEVFSRYRFTVHVPRRAYAQSLPGIPTIRPFEAMACGIPLISAPWRDSEHLFREGYDFRMVADGEEMQRAMYELLAHPEKGDLIRRNGRETVLDRHTCAHRVDELVAIAESLETELETAPPMTTTDYELS